MTEKTHLIIIHGLLTPRIQTHGLLKFMKKRYTCHYFTYSVKETLPVIIERLNTLAQSLPSFHVITFSFGSIVIRNFAEKFGAEKIKRVVMVAPPNKGSELLRAIMKTGTGQRLFRNLCNDFVDNEDQYLPEAPKLDVGIIIGTVPQTSPSRAVNTFVSKIFNTIDSDGKVKQYETELPYPYKKTELNFRHDEVIKKHDCFTLAYNFLETGAF